MARGNLKKWLAALAFSGIPLVFNATCNPQTGFFDLFRDDDYGDYYYDDGYYYDDYYYYDDCYDFECY